MSMPPFGEWIELPTSALDPLDEEELDELADRLAVKILQRLGHYISEEDDAVQERESETLSVGEAS